MNTIEKKFHERGYTSYLPGPFHNQSIEICFQKRFVDQRGTKYFIDIQKWKEMVHPHTHEVIPPNYEYSVQLYKKDTHNAVNVEFFSDWELEDVEEYVEWMFSSGRFDYYELNETEQEV